MWSLYTFNNVIRKSASHKQCAHNWSDYTIQLTYNKMSVTVRGIYDVWQVKGLMPLRRKSEENVNCLVWVLHHVGTWLSNSPSGGRGEREGSVHTWAFQHDRHNAKVQNGPQKKKKKKKKKKKHTQKKIQCSRSDFLHPSHRVLFISSLFLPNKQQTEHFNSRHVKRVFAAKTETSAGHDNAPYSMAQFKKLFPTKKQTPCATFHISKTCLLPTSACRYGSRPLGNARTKKASAVKENNMYSRAVSTCQRVSPVVCQT